MSAISPISIDWQAFVSLEGAPTRNFETLCRAIVMRRFQQYGVLSNYRNQAGVEFTLRVNAEGELGLPGRVWGWQCKWYYPLPQSRALSPTRKKEITEAVTKAEESDEGITDFVLCLPLRPKSGDIKWYYALSTSMTLHLWADEDFEAHLVGAAAELRSTFFGELVLSLQDVSDAHMRSVAPIRDRWFREVHTESATEKELNLLLLRPGSMPQLSSHAERLASLADGMSLTRVHGLDNDAVEALGTFTSDVVELGSHFQELSQDVQAGNLEQFALQISRFWNPDTPISRVRSLGRSLRKIRSASALDVAAAEIEVVRALQFRDELLQATSPSVIAIVGDAGKGKTQLAAEITGSDKSRPGVFIRAVHLAAGAGLDELTKRIPRLGLDTFDDLIRAADALGQRAGYRVPIVIDGLNESQRPSDWKALLDEVVPHIKDYPNVVLILTMRGAVLEECLPSNIVTLELDWDDAASGRLTSAYFNHYKIDRGRLRVPRELFKSPLFLKLYCEATNSDREHQVGPEKYPSSLAEVFELYVDTVAARLRNQSGHPALPQAHIERKLADLSQAIWAGSRRTIPYDEAKLLLDESNVDWDHSLLRRLEEEGILYRDDSEGIRHEQSGILYDALAGHLVADSILSSVAARDRTELLGDASLWARISGAGTQRHELADDVLHSLVALVPRRSYKQQLWKFAPEDARDHALIQTLLLESDLVDDDTIHELAPLIRRWQQRAGRSSPWTALWQIADSPKHRLNGRFLNKVLYGQDITERDLSWSEWIRSNTELLINQLQRWDSEWLNRTLRSDADDLRALSVAWLLTSTDRRLRDNATRTLKCFGSPEPARLCQLATSLLDVNDPYVIERVLAAVFGALTDHQMPEQTSSLIPSLRVLLKRLDEKFLSPDALDPTWNINIRSYVEGLIEYATKLQPDALPSELDPATYSFKSAEKPIPSLNEDDEGYEADHAMHMDFSNYTLGYLYPNRRNYDFEHSEYAVGAGEVRRRIWDLGWRKTKFGSIDKEISALSYARRDQRDAAERYGKKYGWIAYFELAGRRHSQGSLRSSPWDTYRGITPDIDPTFPKQPIELSVELPPWSASNPELSTADWVRGGEIDIPDKLLKSQSLTPDNAEFVLVEGHLEHKSDNGRTVWGFARAFLVDAEYAERVVRFLASEEYLGNDLIPRCPSPADCFAGEMPWSRNFQISPSDEDFATAFQDSIKISDGTDIPIELLAQNYTASGYESNVGLRAGDFNIPSIEICKSSSLYRTAPGLDFIDQHGRLASVTRRAPKGWSGDVMYLRQDLLAAYAQDRKLIQIVWGERQPSMELFSPPPQWASHVFQTHADLWRKIHVSQLKPEST
ncbi:NACHT domain-containing protein [Arthrobacter pityocampae]|uniref:NACHT domain-containing protein n=1 Tax=Arthrobacter pityocampae TaxID=547334 RepID=UPI0011B0DC3B|nr:ATP-binding protein [Arthrobacter pityocampae]